MIVFRVDILPGMNIEDATKEIVEMAIKLDAMVTTSFNGFHAIAHPKSTVTDIAYQYSAWCKEESRKYKLSQHQPKEQSE